MVDLNPASSTFSTAFHSPATPKVLLQCDPGVQPFSSQQTLQVPPASSFKETSCPPPPGQAIIPSPSQLSSSPWHLNRAIRRPLLPPCPCSPFAKQSVLATWCRLLRRSFLPCVLLLVPTGGVLCCCLYVAVIDGIYYGVSSSLRCSFVVTSLAFPTRAACGNFTFLKLHAGKNL